MIRKPSNVKVDRVICQEETIPLSNEKIKINFRLRQIWFYENVSTESISLLIQHLKQLEERDPSKDIDLYIHSYGGSVDSFLAFYDIVRTLKCKVNTYALGSTCSAATWMVLSGTGKRYAFKNTRLMIHELSYGAWGTLTDVDIQHKETKDVQSVLNEIVATHCNQDVNYVSSLLKRDTWFNAEQSLQFGMVDEVI